MPKLRTIIFLCIINLLFNFGISILIVNLDTLDIGSMIIVASRNAIIPFIALIDIPTIFNFNPEIASIFALVTVISSLILSVLYIFIILSIASNIIWHPDV